MSKVIFYLEKRKDKITGVLPEDNIQIMMDFNFEGKRLQLYTGERINRKQFDSGIEAIIDLKSNKPKQKRIHNGKVKKAYAGSQEINLRLQDLSERAMKIYRDAKILNEIITPEIIRRKLKPEKQDNPKDSNVFTLFDSYISMKKSQSSAGFIKHLNTTKNHLERFTIAKNKKICLEDFDYKVISDFINYLSIDKKLSHNTVASIYKRLKFFLSFYEKNKYKVNEAYKSYKMGEIDSEIIFLTWEELTTLSKFKFEKSDKRLESIRDVFCFGCYTGLRYSDIFNLKKDSIKNDYIHVYIQKTKDFNKVPLNKYSSKILQKYSKSDSLKALPVLTNQKMNEALKIIGEKAELNESINIVRYFNNERKETSLPKYKLLTTHIARKTFITNSLRLGMQSDVIMPITGLKSYKTLKRYMSVTDDHKLREMKKFYK